MSRLFVPAIALSLVVASTSAFAHAELKGSSPAANASLQSAPSEVVIEFTEEVEPKFSTIEMHDFSGTRVDNGDVHAVPENAKHLAVGLKPLQPGTYKVIWRITSTDTHKTSGSYTFKVAQ
jgi:copper resistance protein C